MSRRPLGRLAQRVADQLPLPLVRPISIALRRKSFPLVHSGRCGSTVLLDLLGQHPEVVADGEILGSYDRRTARWPPLETLERRMLAQIGRYYCFSTKTSRWDDLSPEKADLPLADYVRGLVRIGFSAFVVIRRKNLLAQSVSGIVARERGSWHTTDVQKQAVRVRVPVEGGRASALVEGMIHLESMYAELDRLLARHECLHLTYEDDVLLDPLIGYAKICDHVGIAQRPVAVRLRQTNPFALRDVVANYDEVQSALAGTAFAWMLE